MLNAVGDRHWGAGILVESAIGNGIGARHCILAAELVEGGVSLAHVVGVLRDGDVADLLYTSIAHFLLHLDLYTAGRTVGGTFPSGVFKTEGLVGEFIDVVLEVGAGNGVEHVLGREPQVP